MDDGEGFFYSFCTSCHECVEVGAADDYAVGAECDCGDHVCAGHDSGVDEDGGVGAEAFAGFWQGQ